MKRIPLECPVCGRVKLQKIPESVINRRNECQKGIVAILIPEGTICDHLFIVHVDRNFSVRDSLSQEGVMNMNKKKMVNVNDIDSLVRQLSKSSVNKLLSKL